MIIAGYMENSMKEQKTETLEKADSLLLRLAESSIGGNHHISEKLGIKVREIPFGHGKRQYIGRFVKAPVFTVQSADCPITYDRYGQLAIDEAQGA